MQISSRMLLTLSLAIALTACGDDPPVSADASKAPTDSTGSTLQPAQAAQKKTPYEAGLIALLGGSSVHFESEVTRADGQVQYALGSGQVNNFAFSIRTLPADTDIDGTWVVKSDSFLKQGTSAYEPSFFSPSAVLVMLDALKSLPKLESELSSDPLPADSAAGVACQPHKVNLVAKPELLMKFTELAVCVDEGNARIVKISARLTTGEQLSTLYTAHGEPVQVPKVEVLDWTKEYPRG